MRKPLILAVAAMAITSLGIPVPAPADAETLGSGPGFLVGAPILWRGGAAWVDSGKLLAATATSPAAPVAGVPTNIIGNGGTALDAGSGDDPSGDLVWGVADVNDQVPPMGPGDEDVPAPDIPYGDSLTRFGLVGSAGPVALPAACNTPILGGGVPLYLSVSGANIAVPCLAPSVLTTAAPQTVVRSLSPYTGQFQVSGNLLAHVDVPSNATRPPDAIVVEDALSGAVMYRVPLPSPTAGTVLEPHFALGEDGTLVVATGAPSPCPTGAIAITWYSPASPVAHPLGCFYGGARRPVGGRWVGVVPGPGAGASLVVVDLVTGVEHTVATADRPASFEPTVPAVGNELADFDGTQVAWIAQTCTGVRVELTPDVDAVTAPAGVGGTCPVVIAPRHTLYATHGLVHVALSCPMGCRSVDVEFTRSALEPSRRILSLPASTKPRTIALQMSRHELSVVLRHRTSVRVTLVASSNAAGPTGTADQSKATMHFTLRR